MKTVILSFLQILIISSLKKPAKNTKLAGNKKLFHKYLLILASQYLL